MLLVLFFSVSCINGSLDNQFQSIEKNTIHPSGINIDYPREGTIFPPEFPSPKFLWHDSLNVSTKWHVRVSTKNGNELFREIVESPAWRPDSAAWLNIKTISATESVFFTIIGEPNGILGSKFSSGRVSFSFSKDSVGASIFYRAVPLPFSYAVKNVNTIEWYSGNIAGGKPQKVLDNIPVCANCHSFSKNGLIAMDIDYANDKGSYIIATLKDTVNLTFDKIITWSDYKREDGGHTYGLLSQVSPNGKYVLSTVKDRSVFVAVDNLEYSQLFFPIKGIIAVYDRETKKFYELPGASDKTYVQSNPNWSPDNREVMFTRANRYISSKIDNSESVLLNLEDVKEFVSGQKDFKFDLYRIPFNEGKGGQAIPVPGASNNHKSNFFARYSPDGKWVVFCQSENFMLLQPDSKLYIMPAEGGTPRLMKCNTPNMNSWHSWSPNSKWLVFSSKIKGPYTKLYLTHIDENGIDSPPVFLENMAFDKRAANIPEFFGAKVNNFRKMTDNFSQNALYYNRLATSDITDKKYLDALKNIDKAIKTDSSFFDAYENRFVLNIILGQSKSKSDLHDKRIAKRLIEKQIQQNPGDKSLIIKRGELRLLLGDNEGAIQDGLSVLKSDANNYGGYDLISSVYQKMGELSKAIPYLKKMLELQPDNTHVSYNLAVSYKNINQLEPALKLLNGIIERYPDLPVFYIARASVFIMKGDRSDAKADYDKAISVDPRNYSSYRERALFFMNNSNPDQARNDLNKAIAILGDEIGKNPQDAPLLLYRAELMEQTGNVQGAFNEYETYSKSWPINYSVLKNKAQTYNSHKQWQQAIDSYTTIIENFPEDIKIFFSRSLAFQASGNLQKALDDLNMAIHMDPNEYTYFYFRSRIKNQLGDKAGYNSDLKTTAILLKEQSTKRKLDKIEQDLMTQIQTQLHGQSK
ncbi:MAG TPA: tetratricopeptide repeat protein [Prolixibacteraceae bacterium]|nr:tetratricopeptide repeat protein [Prolixibacteraceae bacterium]